MPSQAGMALSQWLKQQRADVLIEWKPQLRDAKSMCTVGTVYLNSPAQTAGLRTSDSVVAFGPVQRAVWCTRHRPRESASDGASRAYATNGLRGPSSAQPVGAEVCPQTALTGGAWRQQAW